MSVSFVPCHERSPVSCGPRRSPVASRPYQCASGTYPKLAADRLSGPASAPSRTPHACPMAFSRAPWSTEASPTAPATPAQLTATRTELLETSWKGLKHKRVSSHQKTPHCDLSASTCICKVPTWHPNMLILRAYPRHSNLPAGMNASQRVSMTVPKLQGVEGTGCRLRLLEVTRCGISKCGAAYIFPTVAGLVVHDGKIPHLDLRESHAVCYDMTIHIANLQVGRALHHRQDKFSLQPWTLHMQVTHRVGSFLVTECMVLAGKNAFRPEL